MNTRNFIYKYKYVIILIIIFLSGIIIPLIFHKKNYIFNPKFLLVIDAEDSIKNFDKNNLYCIEQDVIVPNNILEDIGKHFLIRKITVIPDKSNEVGFSTEVRTFFNIKYSQDIATRVTKVDGCK